MAAGRTPRLVAVAGGRSRSAAQGVVSWIGGTGHFLVNVHRVLNKDGEISPSWTLPAMKLPANAREAEQLLRREAVHVTAGRADPDERWRARPSTAS
jgi:hypothetical protein